MKTEIKINNRWDELPPEIQLEMTHLINSIASHGGCDVDQLLDMLKRFWEEFNEIQRKRMNEQEETR